MMVYTLGVQSSIWSFFCSWRISMQSWSGSFTRGVSSYIPGNFDVVSQRSHFSVFPVPFLSRLLPSDVVRIYKCGSCIRLDSSLGDFSEMRWSRGDLSFIFDGESTLASNTLSMVVLDNQTREYQRIKLLGSVSMAHKSHWLLAKSLKKGTSHSVPCREVVLYSEAKRVDLLLCGEVITSSQRVKF